MPTGQPAGRRIGRILALGFPLPGPLVDNFNFATAPAFFDYDAIVVDPASLAGLIEGLVDGSVEAEGFSGRHIRNIPEQPHELAFADILLRRREETAALLAHDGLVVCFAAAPIVHHGIAGAEPLDDYYWLPDDVAAATTTRMIVADGARVRITDCEHPLAAFVESQLANIAYRAYFDVSPDDRHGVFAESAGGKAVAVELPAGHGRVIFLPALHAMSGDARYAMSDILQAGMRRALGVMAEGRPPGWVDGITLPGIDERRGERDTAMRARDDAQARLGAADEAYDERARLQRLLWQEGALGLEDVVAEALRIIGFDVHVSDRGEVQLQTDTGAVLVEIEASEYAVGMAPHHRLRQRIEQTIERGGPAPRGLLVVNGFRLQPPDERPQQVTDAVRTAAETMRYCITTSAALFAAVVQELEGADAAVDTYRGRLLTTDGIVGLTSTDDHDPGGDAPV